MTAVSPASILLVVMAVASATVHLYAEYRGPKWLVYLMKPLTTALLVGAAASAQAADPLYRWAILVGLGFSLAGDVFLMLPGDRFVAGLASFLAAHIAYLTAFSLGVGFGSRPVLLLPYATAAIAVMWLLWSRLGSLRVHVVIYVAALVAMAWQATTRAAAGHTELAVAAAAGATLFVVSDASLAINRFRGSFRAAQVLVMSTYVAAQALIALSVSQTAGYH
jgi:uncharacterized membrane protein YhhN